MSEAKLVGSSFDNPLRLIVLGHNNPGKTAAIVRLVQGHFPELPSFTIDDDFQYNLGDVCVDIHDTASVQEFSAWINQCIMASHVALLMYNSTSKSSFEEAKDLIETIHFVRECARKRPLPFVLVASFIDLDDQRQVTTEEGQALAAEHGVPYMELSSKTGQGVREAFEEAVKLGIETVANENVDESKQTGDKRCAIQ